MDNKKIASEIVAKIEWDINDRSGMDMSGLDDETQDDIREAWTKAILGVLDNEKN